MFRVVRLGFTSHLACARASTALSLLHLTFPPAPSCTISLVGQVAVTLVRSILASRSKLTDIEAIDQLFNIILPVRVLEAL